MKHMIAIALCSILTLSFFSGCAPKCPEPTYVYVPQKCVIPPVDEPVIDNNRYESSEDIVSKALLNYVEMKKYATKLLKSQEVCR